MVLYMCGQSDTRQYNLVTPLLTPVKGSTQFSAKHHTLSNQARSCSAYVGLSDGKAVFLQQPSKSFVTVTALPTQHCPPTLIPVVQGNRKPMLTMNVLQPDVLKGHKASLDGSRMGGRADRVTQPTLLLWHVEQVVGGSAHKEAD